MTQTYKLQSPLRVIQSKKKKFTLNLNIYRNTHYQTLNKAKIEYKKAMKAQIELLPEFKVVWIAYQLYVPNKRRMDIDNVIAVHQKFFQDALVEFGKIPDDSYDYITKSIQLFGGIDPTNPRVDITIQPQ